MTETNTFTRREVERSFRKFRDIVNDLFSAKFQQWGDRFTHLIAHCENDTVMKVITEPLKTDNRVDAAKWWNDAINSVRGMVGSGSYTLPTDDDERTALIYQVLLGVEYHNFNIQKFNLAVYGYTKYQDMVDEFNRDIVSKFTRELGYRLDEIMNDNQDAAEIPREAMLVFHHHDSSTTVHGNFQGISGNVSNSEVTQNLNMTVAKNDFDSLRQFLLSAGLNDDDVNELETAISADPAPASPDQVGPAVTGWIGKIITKAATGAKAISTSAAGGLLTRAIWAYYGFE